MEDRIGESQFRARPIFLLLALIVIGVGFSFFALCAVGLFDFPRRAVSSKTIQEMRSIAWALEQYYVEHSTFPVAVEESGVSAPPLDKLGIKQDLSTAPLFVDKREGGDLPCDYRDWFTAKFRNKTDKPYFYATNGERFILSSVGYDRDRDLDKTAGTLESEDWPGNLSPFHYDPANGSYSSGDIIRYGPIHTDMLRGEMKAGGDS